MGPRVGPMKTLNVDTGDAILNGIVNPKPIKK